LPAKRGIEKWFDDHVAEGLGRGKLTREFVNPARQRGVEGQVHVLTSLQRTVIE
jgi:hypothetical protein